MDLSATQKGRKPGQKKQQNNRSGKKSITYYGCGKEGHMKRDCRSSGKVQRTQFNTITRTPKELNVTYMQHGKNGKFLGTYTEVEIPPPAHDSRRLNEGAQCYDDNCLFHKPEKKSPYYHFILSKAGCPFKGCEIAYLGYTGVPIKIREFNIMIRPAKKVSKDPPEQLIYGRTSGKTIQQERKELRDACRLINNPNHPRHFTTDWRECIHAGCITHEAARQAEEDGIPPVSNQTHPDHRILDWTECASKNCEIHRVEKEENFREITRQIEEGKGWALNEDETQRIQAYVND
jgi:hypothetical protein